MVESILAVTSACSHPSPQMGGAAGRSLFSLKSWGVTLLPPLCSSSEAECPKDNQSVKDRTKEGFKNGRAMDKELLCSGSAMVQTYDHVSLGPTPSHVLQCRAVVCVG